ncbi:DUF551 domain-containing protein [Cronobacter sakazakii]|nr:DUF551 domain-containing protein [Cronobacter sakazakii]
MVSEISKERVEALASNILECHDVKPSEVKALAALALMALRERAEPVAWRNDEGPFAVTRFKSVAETWMAKGWKITPLYTAPPAPVAAGWIACSERMPEREYVLAADFSGAYYLPSLPNTQVGIYADWFEDGKPSWDDGDGNDLHLKQVTHWMPLPEAPGKEE